MNRITRFINQFSFSRKLAISFFICSLLTFAVIDVILHVLYATVVTSTSEDSAFDTQAFSKFSNSQILSSSQSYIHSGVDIYEDIVSLIYYTYGHFYQNPNIYVSKQSKGKNPALASTFSAPRYDRSCMFFLTSNSTFYNHPYLDKVIASSATNHYPSRLRRINIIYQSKSNPNDVSARTMPATTDFYIPNASVINSRFSNLRSGVILNTNLYTDLFSLSDNTTKLIALRLLVPNTTGFNMLIEVEIYSDILNFALSNIYSFPSTKVVLVKQAQNQSKYAVMGTNSQIPPSINLSNYLLDGSKNAMIDGYEFLVTTKTYVDQNNDVGFQQQVSTKFREVNDSKMIIFLNKTQSQMPNIVYQEFLSRQYYVLVFILYGWTFTVLLVVFAIGFVVGDIIFSYFSEIRKKLKQYLQSPDEIKLINVQFKQRYKNTSNNGVIFQNIVQIMQGIQSKKRENRKNFKINSDIYPSNPMGLEFQSSMRKKDYHRLQKIAELIKEKQQYVD